MARHRSPSGAGPVPEHVAFPRVALPAGGHRLPAPPTPSLRARVTVAALAGGALVAAAQTFVSAHGIGGVSADPYAKLAQSAMLPVTEHPAGDAASAATTAIGGDQLAANALSIPSLDDDDQLDVAAIAKAYDINAELTEKAKILRAALAEGAPQAVLSGGRAYVLPTAGRFTSGFGARWGVTHYGIDLAAPIGTPIYAFTDGFVEESGPASGFGLWVVLRHPDGTSTVYGHINRSFVTVGQRVSAGEQIAEVGNRGQSTGPHLHFEVWDAAKNKVNPVPRMNAIGLNVTGRGSAAA